MKNTDIRDKLEPVTLLYLSLVLEMKPDSRKVALA